MSVPQEAIDGARAYESLHVPALFDEWAPRILDAANVDVGHAVLDVACGTGIVARHAIERVGANGSVAGLDATPGMLVVARELAPSVDFRDGVAEALPFDDAVFDAVVSQFGLMFFSDREGALREMLRVLKPGGRLAIAVWESLENSQAYDEEVELFQRMAGDAAANAMSAPFNMGGEDRLASLFEQAGVVDANVSTIAGTAHFPNIRSMIEADLRGWLPVLDVHLDDELIEAILAEAENVFAKYRLEDGTVRFDAPAHIASGAKS